MSSLSFTPPGRVCAQDIQARADKIRILVFDVDGVLTDGTFLYGADGEALKRFNVKDGHGIVLARELGFQTAILTARSSPIVETRANELKITHVLQGQFLKARGFAELLKVSGFQAEQAAYIGDDVNDLPVFAKAGLCACPHDSAEETRAAAHYITSSDGGRGAVREFIELVLKAQNKWNIALKMMFANSVEELGALKDSVGKVRS